MAEESALIARRCQEARETRRLSLNGCGLRKFPDAVFFLVRDAQLESVNLSGNQLKRIPAKLVEKFTTITSLDLSDNDLSALPDAFSILHCLTHLTLSHNTLTTLPPTLATLPVLATLEVGSNRICHIMAAELDAFPMLRRLVVGGNPLTEESKVYLTTQDKVEVVWEGS